MKMKGFLLVLVIVAFAASFAFGGAGELNFVQQIWSRVNTNLDTTISSRAASSTALSTATWTATRAGKLDNADTTVSSRAASSTALSTATWTATRAGKLDNADTTVSSRASQTSVNLIPTTPINSIQRVNCSSLSGGSCTVNITAVTLSKSLLLCTASYNYNNTYAAVSEGYECYFVDSDTVGVDGAGGLNSMSATFQVIEFK